LRATGVGAGDEVIVPTFCCASIIPPVLAIGAVPVLADVGDNLTLTSETVEAVRSPRTRAVIVAHLFGNPAAVETIANDCRRHGLVLIDDAAQALGATSSGRPLGTFGDAGIISFGNGKICFGVGGGILVSHRASVLAQARTIDAPSEAPAQMLKHAARVMLWRCWRRWTLPLYVATNRIFGAVGEPPYRRRAMANISAAVALSLMDTLHANLAARRAQVDTYHRLLGSEAGLHLLPHEEGSACLTQVVHFDGGERVALKVVRVLRDAGYEVGRSFEPLHLQVRYREYARASMPRAEASWRSLVELPCEPSVGTMDIRRIAAIVQAVVGTS